MMPAPVRSLWRDSAALAQHDHPSLSGWRNSPARCPRLVAEDGGALADPFPQRCRAGEPGVTDERPFVELARLEADRADEQLAAVGVLLEQPCERRAAIARDSVGIPRQRQPYGLLGHEHRHLLALLERRDGDEEGAGHALGVLEAGGEVDYDLVV